MADWDSLENCCGCKPTVGSNPTLSARYLNSRASHNCSSRAVSLLKFIELMLAHMKEKTKAAYNRALHLKRRRELAQLWADVLLEDFAPAADLLTMRRQ